MGSDIHLHTEVKINGEWLHHSEANIHRNYALFAKMANVRNSFDIKPFSPPRGLPEGCSFLTKMASDIIDTDGHSHSWLNADEIYELKKFIEDSQYLPDYYYHNNFPPFMGHYFAYFKTEKEYWPDIVEDIRFVFWFDN